MFTPKNAVKNQTHVKQVFVQMHGYGIQQRTVYIVAQPNVMKSNVAIHRQNVKISSAKRILHQVQKHQNFVPVYNAKLVNVANQQTPAHLDLKQIKIADPYLILKIIRHHIAQKDQMGHVLLLNAATLTLVAKLAFAQVLTNLKDGHFVETTNVLVQNVQ